MFELNSGDVEHASGFNTGYDGSKKKGAWATFLDWDKPLLVLLLISLLSALAALFVLMTPVLDMVVSFMGLSFSRWTEWQEWIMEGERGLIIAPALGLIALLFALLARYRLSRIFSVYMEAGCPQCHELELIRVRRNRKDRALGKIGLPVRRYSCRNCTWHGLRLAGYRYRREEAPEMSTVIGPDNEMVDAQIDLAEESLLVGAMEIDAAAGAEIQANGNDVLFSMEDAIVNLVDEPSESSKDLSKENNAYFEEWVAETQLEEKVIGVSIDTEPAVTYQQLDEELDQAVEGVSSPLEADPFEESDHANGNGAGIEPEVDDDFARLCYKVAQSKE